MRASSAYLALAGVALAASLPHSTFYYEMSSSMRRMDEGCRVCYGDDCLLLSPARCEYFMEIDEITDKPERDGEGSHIDTMMSELMEQATMSWLAQQCIPLVSQYTTCNKENLCVGCEICQCSESGRWSCSQVQRCRNERKPDTDHRTLVLVMEKLLEYEKKVRRKRLVENITDATELNSIGLMDIAEWMYGVTPATDMDMNTSVNDAAATLTPDSDGETATALTANEDKSSPVLLPFPGNTETTIPSTQSQTITDKIYTESEYLGFEEVLKNIANDQIYKRRKSNLYENSEIALDYMDLEDTKTTGNNTSENFMEMLNALEEGNNVTDPTSDGKFVVDLYPRKYKNNNDTATEYGDTYYYKEENNTIDFSPEKIELDSINIMKRDVSSVTNKSNTTQDTTTLTTALPTTSDKGHNDLNKHVLVPLTNILNDKQNELKELLQIRENLLNIMEIFDNKSKINISEKPDVINGSNTHFSIYKLDLYPEIHEDLRRINPNVLSKLLYKLKRDIYEVFRDISRIQKFSKTEELPDDLRLLIRSMKYYVSKQGSSRNFKKNEILLQKPNETRRFWLRKNLAASKSIIRQFVDILEVIDKDTRQSNDFEDSSKSTKKIIRRVIKQNYVDEYSVLGLKSYDSEYNLTNDLRTIGKSWPHLTAKLANSPPHEKLYAMKLLHFTLAGDINKITDALALIDFAQSRRMTPIETPMAEEVMEKINSGLISIKRKIQSIIKYQIEHEKIQLREREHIKRNKKESFLKRIRNMLRSSKKDIISMVKKKVPKTEIFRTIAQKKLDELSQKKVSDNEQTMLKWQNILHVQKRKKRDVAAQIKTMKSRMKNIIPKYLRGKINPAIAKHKSKKQLGTKKKKINKHKNLAMTVKPIKKAKPTKSSVPRKRTKTTTSPSNLDTTTVKNITQSQNHQ